MSNQTILIESARAAPPVAVTTWITFVSNEIDLWIKVLTLVFLILQIVLVAKKIKKNKKGDE